MDTLSLGLLILRLVVGLTITAHGAQKLFGWADGPGFARLTQGFDKQGLKPGAFWAGLAVVGEFGGGLSLAFGFLTPLGAAGIVGAMFMAVAKTHWSNGFWSAKRGYEYPLNLLAGAVALGLTGPGRFALDPLFGIHLPEAAIFVILAVIAVLVDVAGMLISRSAAVPTAQGARG